MIEADNAVEGRGRAGNGPPVGRSLPGRGGGGREGFHGVENLLPWCGKTAKMASMVWKFSGNLLPWCGKMAKMTSMAWKFLQSDDSPCGGEKWAILK